MQNPYKVGDILIGTGSLGSDNPPKYTYRVLELVTRGSEARVHVEETNQHTGRVRELAGSHSVLLFRIYKYRKLTNEERIKEREALCNSK
jgi:hypothetical protein